MEPTLNTMEALETQIAVSNEYAKCLDFVTDVVNLIRKAKYPHDKSSLLDMIESRTKVTTDKVLALLSKNTPEMSASADHELNAVNALS